MQNEDNHVGLKMKSYTFSRKLGAGAWSTVYEVFDERTRMPVACKVIPKRLMDGTPKLKELVQTEITVLRRCNNENVIRYIDTFSNEKNVYIFTEFCNSGDMEGYLKKKTKLNEDEAREFLKQILNGFRGLHEVGALHRDFKAANILLHNGVAKIADLGFAKIIKEGGKTGTILGTSVTMAPELLQNKSYGIECDIWSVGVVYYQLLTGDYPYNAINDFEILKKIKKGPPSFNDKFDISQDSQDFIRKCLTIDPKKRITWKAIYEHPLLQQKNDLGRSTFLGNLSSKISIGHNQQFYANEANLNKDIANNNNNLDFNKNKFEFPNAQLEEAKDFGKIQDELNRKKTIQAQILKSSALYLERRNKIMLTLKYGITPIFELQEIPFNQNLYAFLLCKQAHSDISDLRKNILNKNNVFGLTNYWNQFVNSQTYKNLSNQIVSDYDLIHAYAQSFMLEIETNNPKLKNELTLESKSKDFMNIFNEELNSYAFLLYDYKDKPTIRKQVLVRLIRYVLDVVKGINVSSEHYDKKMESLNPAEIDKQFAQKMKNLYG